MKVKTTINKGFTLIELMITVAIIGILAAVSLPIYQQYAVKTQITEGLFLGDNIRSNVALYYSIHGVFPADINVLNIEVGNKRGTYIATIAVNNGDVVATFNGPTVHEILKNETLKMHPAIDANSSIKWECTTSLKNTPSKVIYIPNTCIN